VAIFRIKTEKSGNMTENCDKMVGDIVHDTEQPGIFQLIDQLEKIVDRLLPR
jgi:hypothetical protein